MWIRYYVDTEWRRWYLFAVYQVFALIRREAYFKGFFVQLQTLVLVIVTKAYGRFVRFSELSPRTDFVAGTSMNC